MILASLMLLQAAACASPDAQLPGDLIHWSETAADRLSADGAPFETGTRDPAAPAPVAGASPDRPVRPGRTSSFLFNVTKAGRYKLALDQKGWIDVRPISSNSALVSVDHSHGPACSTITKTVTFDLAPGSYYLELSGLARDRAKVMLVSVP